MSWIVNSITAYGGMVHTSPPSSSCSVQPTPFAPYASSDGIIRLRVPPTFIGGIFSVPNNPFSHPLMTSSLPRVNVKPVTDFASDVPVALAMRSPAPAVNSPHEPTSSQTVSVSPSKGTAPLPTRRSRY
eukprot:gnl/TRDRNA2_/TRDRNA2_153206_c0_seq2.p1 gnl/TRDRNA2_/TRDRNA2_153206_c0~~gnl/TRDRNA2_/TRDRNA2_153206_c0_seq2.p1  ORF type:complete len:129 (-),score=4.18 gnl/TRDRNA2_/TRDRNA2_153206_c0_seq2:141-527(-)